MEAKISTNGGSAIGILFELQGKIYNHDKNMLWDNAKQAACEKMLFPHTVIMPCGEEKRFEGPEEILNLPIENIPCSCGNPNHLFVSFTDISE